MEFLISAMTDSGTEHPLNQDSLSVKRFHTCRGPMVFGVLCDGMGGLDRGEVASAAVVRAFEKWGKVKLPQLCQEGITERALRRQWEQVLQEINQRLLAYSEKQGIQMGTTCVAMLLTGQRYYIMNVGDSRAYEVFGKCRQMTMDHTLVAREIAEGFFTEEEALREERRHILLQGIGVSRYLLPDWFFGRTKKDAGYLLCSDGFCREITGEEILEQVNAQTGDSKRHLDRGMRELIRRNRERQETDNISAIVIRTF